MIIDDELWVLAIVPMLATVALMDYLTSWSVGISSKLTFSNPLRIHLATLLVAFAVILLLLNNLIDMGSLFAIKYFEHPERHFLLYEFAVPLFALDGILVLGSILVGLVISVTRRENVLLCLMASLFGTAGSLIWMYRIVKKKPAGP